MQKLKFRAWDKVEKTMTDPFVLGSLNAGDCFNGWDWEVMLFTGITDTTGKEIFENDIIRYSDGRIAIVTWSEDMYAFDFESNDYVVDQEGGCVSNGQVEIIGNFYENRELLPK